jgi:Ca2+-binding EF-hand superfamily protein
MFLGQSSNFSDDIWKNMVKELDKDNDGEISFDDFRDAMGKV